MTKKSYNIRAINDLGFLSIHCACENGWKEPISAYVKMDRDLLDYCVVGGGTPLIAAAEKGSSFNSYSFDLLLSILF